MVKKLFLYYLHYYGPVLELKVFVLYLIADTAGENLTLMGSLSLKACFYWIKMTNIKHTFFVLSYSLILPEELPLKT